MVRVPSRDEVLRHACRRTAWALGVHYPVPVHLTPAMADLGHGAGDFPVSEAAAGEILSLPMFPGITRQQQERVVGSLLDAVRRHGD